MYSDEEFDKFLNRVSILNDLTDSTIDAIGAMVVTIVVVVALKLVGLI